MNSIVVLFEYYTSDIVDYSSYVYTYMLTTSYRKQFLITINQTNHSCWFISGPEDTKKLYNQTSKQYCEISGKFPSQ